MGVARQAVLDTASGWVGMLEETGNNDIWFSRDWGIEGQSWCFAFTQSGFYYAPVSPGGKLPHESMYCPYGIAWARQNGQAVEVDQAGPIPGDIVFFSWDMVTWPRWRAGTGDHVGIVEAWDGGDILWTIEGNIGSPQGVYRKVRSISETVVCFWRPTVYDDGSFGVAAIPEEEDMTPEQVKMAEETRNLVGGAFDQAVAANTRLDDIRKYVGGAYDQAMAVNTRLDQLSPKIEALEKAVRELPTGGPKPPTLPPVRVVDVDESLKQATAEQLAALGKDRLVDAVLLALRPTPAADA